MVHVIVEYFDPKLLYLFCQQHLHSCSRYRDNRHVSMGAEKWLDIELWSSIHECFKVLKSRGYRIATTHVGMDAVLINLSAVLWIIYNQVLKSKPILCLADSLVYVCLGIHLRHGLVTPNCDSCWKWEQVITFCCSNCYSQNYDVNYNFNLLVFCFYFQLMF